MGEPSTREPTDRPDGHTPIPPEELRLAVVLNGGVSLAVWMGGVSVELNRLAHGEGPYKALLDLAGGTARIDVIAGTSAGGINGAALALAQANELATLQVLRDIWADEGRFETLLRQPFRGSPDSLLRGDEFFLPRLNDAMRQLALPYRASPAAENPIDLTITTTLLRGTQLVTVDSTGQQLPQWVHDGRFHFRRDPAPGAEEAGPFSPQNIARTADQLGLAARSTASFPVAFEPSFIPVDAPGPAAEEQPGGSRIRPDMGDVASWARGGQDSRAWGWAPDDTPPPDLSRFVVDGGLLANMPTRSALHAVESMPASGPVRRVVLLVHPHAPMAVHDRPDEQSDRYTVLGSLSAMLGALSAQGSRTFVEDLEKHNVMAAGRRGTRGDILVSAGGPDGLAALVQQVFTQYRRLRMWRAGRDVARFSAPHEGWNYDRIRRSAQAAQEQWLRERLAAADSRPTLPYVPVRDPLESSEQAPTGWAWGVSAAIGVADACADLLRQLIWVLPPGPDYEAIRAARAAISELRPQIKNCRNLTDDMWREDPILRQLEPNQTLFHLRLAWYEWAMVGGGPGGVNLPGLRDQIGSLIAVVAAHATQTGVGVGGLAATAADVETALRAALLGHGSTPADPVRVAGAIGQQVHELVDRAIAELEAALPALGRHLDVTVREVQGMGDLRGELRHWYQLLATDETGDARKALLLRRLIALEVATTALGDEATTETSFPVEVVQLSAQTVNGFSAQPRTADDKLGGMSINRFGGFLKRSWRLNDWTWGRLDAATVICRLVLDPARLRRAAALRDELTTSPEEARLRAQFAWDLLKPQLFGDTPPPDPRVEKLVEPAVAELAEVYRSDVPIGDLPPTMPHLAELAAWSVHVQIAAQEMPALARAIRADRIDGANPRSNGELFLAEQERLLERLALQEDRGGEPGLTADHMRDATAALTAFDRAGVGRESLLAEGTSDQMIRTATSTTAMAVTLVDSDSSGFSAAKPVTRSLRGAMLLPYWVITGLSAGGALSRALALLGLSIGSLLLALSLFGALPGWSSSGAAALGTSALLVAFAYGALRTGTLLHGVVLLSPLIPLVAFAVEQARTGTDQGEAAGRGVSTLVVVIALALGMMVLGSLPAPMNSVWSSLDGLADRARIPRVSAPAGWQRAVAQARRRALGVLANTWRAAVSVAAVVGLGALLVDVLPDDWGDVAQAVVDHRVLAMILVVLAALAGSVLALRGGNSLRVLAEVPRADPQGAASWAYRLVSHPAGVAVGWSVLYGVGYLVLAAFLLWNPLGWLEYWWGTSMLLTTVVFAFTLLVLVPVILPRRAMIGIERQQVARAREAGVTVGVDDDEFLAGLIDRGLAYRFLVRLEPAVSGQPRLTVGRGRRLAVRVRAAGSVTGTDSTPGRHGG
ncbi:MAG TPA: patatin-like protein [Motilibacterales bacterium]|nr:patatin-like protein [Motilibacterales bacterium]